MDQDDGTVDAAPGRPPTSVVRRRVIIAVGVFALAGLAYLAGAGAFGGLLPTGDDASWEAVEWGTATAVAEDVSGEIRAEVRVGTAGGARCALVGGAAGASPVVWGGTCGDPLMPWDDPDFVIARLDDYFGAVGQYPVRRTDDSWAVVLAGAVHPDVARVTAVFGDGAEYSFVTRNDDGWFVTVLPADIADPDVLTGTLVNGLARLELFDAEGTRVATAVLPSPVGPLPDAP